MIRTVRPHVAVLRREENSRKLKVLKPAKLHRQERISSLVFAVHTDVKRPRKKMAKRFSYYASLPLVPVLVGRQESPFYVHTSLLNKSPFFRAALQDDRFKEGQERVIRLPEDDVLPFQCFFEWLYLGEHADTGKAFADVSEDDVDARAANFSMNLIDVGDPLAPLEAKPTDRIYDFGLQFQCYVLGDVLQVKEFQDHIWVEIHNGLGDSKITVDLVRYVYDNTMEKDRLRSFCIDQLLSVPYGGELFRNGTVLEIFSGASSSDLKADFNETYIRRLELEAKKRAAAKAKRADDEEKRKKEIDDARKEGRKALYEELRARGCLRSENWRWCCVDHSLAFP